MLFPAVLITASAVGVEYSINNVAYKVLPEKMDHVRTGVDVAVSRMALKIHQRWAKEEDGQIMKASTRKHGVDIFIIAVTEKTTRLRVDAFNKEFTFLKDKALAAAVIVETEKELRAMGLLRASR
ncbi:MAG: hypothetical protein O2807_05260 [bacterium]|nr:hypothetical protein [bacterium]